MTTKPKAKKFRIRRNPAAPAGETPRDGAPEAPPQPAQPPQGQQAAPRPGRPPAQPAQPAQSGQVASAREGQIDQDIDAIRREGLTGRQLRMARRVAQKNGLAPTSDFDAVRLLRARGIDPFQRTNMLELVVPENQPQQSQASGQVPAEQRVQLPQTVPADGRNFLPSTELNPAERRAQEITSMQRDIARRRRKRLMLLMTRLSFFVFLPTMLAAWYFYVVATPMYATKSEFLILQADNAGGGGIGGLLSGTQFATNQDSIAVQSYLQSKDAMIRLDGDEGFKAHFSQPWIDPIQRLSENPSNEEAYSQYKKSVTIGYDPTEGVIRMEVAAADPQVAARFSQALITYAEERVDNLTQRKREDQMADAIASFEKAEAERRAAQEKLVRLQQEGSILDPEGKIASIRSQISNFEVQLQEKELQLQALLDNRRPNQSRVDGVRADIGRLQGLLARLNADMTQAAQGENSLAAVTVQIQMAQADVATRDLMLQSALQQLEQTRMEANRQVRYLTTSVEPVASDDPSYPRKFENTVLAFLIFGGIYLMVSITASILREQVSS